jgi:CO/xanthine dehydrogenase FAD-binding subunit
MDHKRESLQRPGSAGQTWTIDANEALQGVLESEGCPSLLQRSLTGAMTWQDRNRRLVGRALVSPSIAPRWTAALLALGASVTLAAGDEEKTVPFEALFDRRIKGNPVSLHVPAAGVRWGEAHVGRTPADEPIVAATAGVELQDGIVSRASVALTGAWSKPVGLVKSAELLVGSALGSDGIQAVSQAVEEEVAPNGDFRGSEEYRRAMAGVLTRRALMQCLDQEA